MEQKQTNITEVAKKQRYLHLLRKVKQDKQLTPKEITELEKFEKEKKGEQQTTEQGQVPKKNKLTARQESFCQAYVSDPARNGTKAAITAGYSEKVATNIAYQNMTKRYIVERIRELELELQTNSPMTKEEIATQYALYAKANITDYLMWDEDNGGLKVKPSHLLTRQQSAAIVEVSQTISNKGEKVIKIKLQNPKDALDSLSKMQGLFSDNVNHKFPEGCGVIAIPAEIKKDQWLQLVNNKQVVVTEDNKPKEQQQVTQSTEQKA